MASRAFWEQLPAGKFEFLNPKEYLS
jgi:hypothetical protein